MNKKRYFRLVVGVFLLLLISLVPRNVMAEDAGGSLSLQITFFDSNGQPAFDIGEDTFTDNLESLEGDGTIIDFSSDQYIDLGISGKISYNKLNKTIDLININNEQSKYSMEITMKVGGTRTSTFNIVGENNIKGSLKLRNEVYYNKMETIITGDGSLNISSFINESCLDIYGQNFKILNTKINLKNNNFGLQYQSSTLLEIVNSTINIQSLPTTSDEDEYRVGIRTASGGVSFVNSNILIEQKGKYANGTEISGNTSYTDSYVRIDTEGNTAYAINQIAYDEFNPPLQFINSEVYLNAKLSKNLNENEDNEAYGLMARRGFAKVSNSAFQAQGDTDAIYGEIDFDENINDVFVKEDLSKEEDPYPVKNKDDKEELGATYERISPYKYVRIEPDLKSFEIDADSQPVDQNIYVFDHWESKGFIIEHPNSKRTTVKIPVIWPKGAYLNAVWRKIDTSNNPKAEVIYQAIPMTFTDVKTVYKTTRLDMAYLKGYPEKTIMPEGNMTRAEAVTTLVRLERYKGKDARDLKENSEPIYSDVEAGIWYKKYIDYAYAQGWLEESKGQMFYPDRPITRAELAQLISYVDNKISEPAPFTDIEGHPFKAAINQAYANGRIKGYEDNTFRPDGNIKRVEVATMLNRLYNRQADKSFISKNQDLITKFKDLDSSHWGYYELVEAFESHQAIENENGSEEWQRLIGGSI